MPPQQLFLVNAPLRQREADATVDLRLYSDDERASSTIDMCPSKIASRE